MIPGPDILSSFGNLIKVTGLPKILEKLFSTLKDRGRTFRYTSLKVASETLLNVEKAKQTRIETLKSLKELMESAGFTEEKIQSKMEESLDLDKAAYSLETISKFIESGKIETLTLYKPEDST